MTSDQSCQLLVCVLKALVMGTASSQPPTEECCERARLHAEGVLGVTALSMLITALCCETCGWLA